MLTEEEKGLVGASDMPALLGLSPWSGPVALWARIVHGWEPKSTADMEAGNAAEAYNRALYRLATGYTLVGPSKWRHPLYPWMRVSPDDTATDTPDGRRGVELKRYNNTEGWGPSGTDVVPGDIWVQVQVQCGAGLDLGHWDSEGVDVSVILRGEHRLYHVPYMAEAWERCTAVAERFWRDFVVPRRVPEGEPLVLLERDADAVAALFPAPTSEARLEWGALTTAQQQAALAWVEANEARKQWEQREKALARQVRFALRDAPGLALPDGRQVDFKQDKDGKRSLVVRGKKT